MMVSSWTSWPASSSACPDLEPGLSGSCDTDYLSHHCTYSTSRYTGTLAALHVVKSLAGVEVKLKDQRARSRRQLQLEQRKSAEARAADRLEMLEAKLNEMEENLTEAATIIDYLVQSVFISVFLKRHFEKK